MEWWRGAVIYQIYPRSFYDNSGDGIGDLLGIVRKLDYIADLGVDAIWISPFFKSPMKDFGYDVSDYRAVDPIFGLLDDFDILLEEAHRRGLKVLCDLVLSHTSNQHPWFQKSRRCRDNRKADWYVWADPKPDGSPPNNWLSIFGGVAWQWESRRRQYYLHNFLPEQPDLNLHNPEVVDAVLAEMEFWLERGVDGFRLDAVNYYLHDPLLRDNPPRPPGAPITDSASADNPYSYQLHRYDKSQPENLEVLARIRELMDRYPGTVTIGEVADDHSLKTTAEYVKGDSGLHMVYNFSLLRENFGAEVLREVVGSLEQEIPDGWPCWAFSNHDVVRAVSRWGHPEGDDGFSRMLMALLLSLRGAACLYQGEELGLTQAEIPYHEMRDPYGLAFYPDFKGRDGCRTPMPWDSKALHAGFSEVRPWLPVPDEHRPRAVSIQDMAPGSLLNAFRRFIHWRRKRPALVEGSLHWVDSPEGILAFERRTDQQRILVIISLVDDERRFPLGEAAEGRVMHGHGFASILDGNEVVLPRYGVCMMELPV